ncbi:hypothetical protein [Kiloniella litopenaei]|uniref:hypothetical protein n=1 Tax=Kiloniella litopenaei TaxID=1549748 RepID=UPI003BA9469E
MNRIGGSLRYSLLFVTVLFVSGCSNFPGKDGFFASKKAASDTQIPTEPQIAARGNAKHEPQVVSELEVPKPNWKPENIPDKPVDSEELAVLQTGEDLTDKSLSITPVITPKISDLLGMSFIQVRDKLGQPVWIRDVYPARVWGYDIESCSLQIFFYPKLDQAGDYRVLAYESGLNGDGVSKVTSLKADDEKRAGSKTPLKPTAISEEDHAVVQACFQKIIEETDSLKGNGSENLVPDS